MGSEWSAPAVASSRLVPESLSVTSLVSYVRCPKQFYWTVVRPLPRQPSQAATLGTAVHRWIEGRADPQLSIFGSADASTADASTAGSADGAATGVGSTTRIDRLRQSFLASRYAAQTPERVEAAFLLTLADRVVRGRVDAAYRHDDGRLELVDYKTGRPPIDGDPGANIQLDLYALAAIGPWGADPRQLQTSYCYLRVDGAAEIVTYDWTDARDAVVHDTLERATQGIRDQRFDPNTGSWCRRCEFASCCPAGTRFLAGSGSTL